MSSSRQRRSSQSPSARYARFCREYSAGVRLRPTLIAASLVALFAAGMMECAAAKDGKNNVIGAIWKVTARNDAGETLNFQFRVKDGKLYDPTGKVLGTVRAIDKGESIMTWNAPLPLQGQFKITMKKVGHWNGVFKTNDRVEWRCRLDVTDR